MSPRTAVVKSPCDPALSAIERAPVVPWTEDEQRAVDEAEREDGHAPHGDVVQHLRDHFGVSAEEWDGAGDADT